MKKITVWLRWNEDSQSYKHNHTEAGHVENRKPTPLYKEQEHWLKEDWFPIHSYINEDKIVGA